MSEENLDDVKKALSVRMCQLSLFLDNCEPMQKNKILRILKANDFEEKSLPDFLILLAQAIRY